MNGDPKDWVVGQRVVAVRRGSFPEYSAGIVVRVTKTTVVAELLWYRTPCRFRTTGSSIPTSDLTLVHGSAELLQKAETYERRRSLKVDLFYSDRFLDVLLPDEVDRLWNLVSEIKAQRETRRVPS